MSEDAKMQGMAIGKGRARLQTTVDQQVKDKFDELAANDYRKTSNLLESILVEWLKEHGHLPRK